MKILVLEDNPNRVEMFKSIYGTEELTLCRTYSEFKEAIYTTRYDKVYLDHDLGIDGTGMDAVHLITNQNLQRQADFVVHSMNYPAAERMVEELGLHGYTVAMVPFIQLTAQLTKLLA